jgi:GPI mannosyltransferase 3
MNQELKNIMGLNDLEWRELLLKWFAIGTVVHIVTAYFSTAWFHFDEHFQILEFMNYKLGLSKGADLTWEFPTMQRPWLQPSIFMLLTKFCWFFGIKNPDSLAIIYRIFSAIFAQFSIFLLALCSYPWFTNSNLRRINLIAMNILWFIPFIHVRTSSENFSGALFIIGFVLITIFYNQSRRYENIFRAPFHFALASGFFLGLAFVSRYTTGIMVAGLGFWAIFLGRLKWSATLFVAIGIILAIGSNALLDRWGYGVWTLSWVNYFDINIIQDKASNFGRDPWYFFITKAGKTLPPVTIIMILGIFFTWVKNWRHPLTWATASLYIIHSIIPAKDIRYFFVFSSALPLLFFMGLQKLKDPEFFLKGKWIVFSKFLLGLNILGLLFLGFKPANTAGPFLRYVSRTYPDNFKFYTWTEGPFMQLEHNLNFYAPKGLETVRLQNSREIIGIVKNSKTPIKVFHDKFFLPEDVSRELGGMCKVEYRFFPDWLENYNYTNWISRSRVWTLFECFGT